jgi:large subunit ribosomal protein L4
METKVYNQEGKETGKIALPERVFNAPWNADLVHQAVMSLAANKRAGTANTKTRGEVRGGGKKPWKQKGTGQARHGSTRSPIWVGGGIAHGPRSDKNYKTKINRKAMAKALYTTLSEKLRNGELLFVESVKLAGGKAKEGKQVLNAFAGIKGFERISKSKNGVFIAGFGIDAETKRGFRNFSNILVGDVRTMTPADTLNYTCVAIVAPKDSIPFLEKKLGAVSADKKPVEKKAKKAKATKKAE